MSSQQSRSKCGTGRLLATEHVIQQPPNSHTQTAPLSFRAQASTMLSEAK